MSKVTDYVVGTACVVGTIAVGAAVVAGTVLLTSAVINSDCDTVSDSPNSTRVSRTETARPRNEILSLNGPIPSGDLQVSIPQGKNPEDIRCVTFSNEPRTKLFLRYDGIRNRVVRGRQVYVHVSSFGTPGGSRREIIWLPEVR